MKYANNQDSSYKNVYPGGALKGPNIKKTFFLLPVALFIILLINSSTVKRRFSDFEVNCPFKPAAAHNETPKNTLTHDLNNTETEKPDIKIH